MHNYFRIPNELIESQSLAEIFSSPSNQLPSTTHIAHEHKNRLARPSLFVRDQYGPEGGASGVQPKSCTVTWLYFSPGRSVTKPELKVAYGTVTPSREGRTNDGRYCREYQSSIYVGGKYEQGVGTACRNPDGTWQIVS